MCYQKWAKQYFKVNNKLVQKRLAFIKSYFHKGKVSNGNN